MRKWLAVVLLTAVAGGAFAQETVRYFPAAAHSPGLFGTFFVTDARVFNPDDEQTITVNLQLLAADSDNSAATVLPVVIGPRQAAALDDLVDTVFAASGAGGVRLTSTMPFLATSRTYNIGDGTSGTFGQFIPGLMAGDALQQGILLQAVNDPAATGFRTNVGFVNPNLTAVTVTVKVFNADTATLIGEGTRSLPPYAYSQINNVFNFVGSGSTVVRNATVEITATAAVLAYASVVDNTSGDAIFLTPYADTGTPVQANRPPDGAISEPAGNVTVTAGASVHFVATASDPDGDTVTGMEWDFGDGVTASGLDVTHTYSQAGTFTATFTATDDQGLADPTPPTRTVTVIAAAATFAQVQSEIFNTSCAFSGCHGGSSPAQGMNLSSGQAYANIVNVASHEQPSLDRIEPSSPSSSYLYLKVTGDPSISGSRMPLGGGALSAERLQLLRSWIEAGAPNN